MAKYTPMIEQYLSIKADYPDAFLFFRLGDFYELFFEDAVRAARELEITLTGRDGGTDERIPMCGVPHHSAESYIKQLIDKGYKVAICEQVEDPKQAKGVVKREVVRVITPGTVMEGQYLEEKENNFILAVSRVGETYGLAACDVTTGEFYATLLENGDIPLLNELSYYQPSEVVVLQKQDIDAVEDRIKHQFSPVITVMDEMGERERTALEERAVTHFETRQDLTAIHKQAIGLLLVYLESTQKRTLDHIRQLDVYESRQYMILDAFTRRNLELVETVRDKSKKGSLLWLLDKTSTAMGGRMLKKWIDKPLIHREAIEERLEAVQFFVEQWMVREELQDRLKQVYDLERLSGRIAYGNANARDLIQIKKSLSIVPEIKQILGSSGSSDRIRKMVEKMDDCQDIVERIGRALVDDPPLSVKEGGIIRPGYHDHLDQLLEAGREGKKWIAELEQREKQATGIKSLKVGYNKVFGYYIEVTKANLSALPEGRYIRKQTLANAERFVTPELKEKESLILEAEEKSVELEYQLFVELRDQIAEQIERIQQLAKQIAELDVLQSLATVSQENGFVRPQMRDASSGTYQIVEGRHPVVEAVLRDESFVPNDVRLHRDEEQILLITGPNMAGKSTYMRQVALMVIMAQMGCFVPASEAILSIVDRIFTRIGAADDLTGGQSTFMVEMNDIKITTRQATRNSLVIIDELGRGTSTADGMAIAQSVIEYIHDHIGCVALVSTHYHELAGLEQQLPRLKNVSMAVTEKEDEVIFLRRLKEGAASKSYGIYVAKIAGVPEKIVRRAEELLQYFEGQHQILPEAAATSEVKETPAEPVQLDIFGETPSKSRQQQDTLREEQRIVEELEKIDLLNMTPLDAMNKLYELKKLLK
ncbi:MAG: DNA mismatch repair protein MutS [Bacillaceae bacterium]|nr:DNA mismatch repair protein MutS [Bacillaceae bacterium]